MWNPAAGGKGFKILKAFSVFLNDQNVNYRVFDTGQSRSATRTVRENLDESFTDIVIVGGDGTINESINGLERDIPVSIIPAGTGDDFIKMVDLGPSEPDRFKTALNGTIRSIDIGVCNERKFINGVGIGFDGQIVEDMIEKRVPLLKGHAAYYYHVLRILGGYREKHFSYHFNDVDYSKDLILLTIGNGSTFGGGFKLMPDARIDDGLLDICEIGKLPPLKRFLNIHRLSKGTHGVLPRVNFYKAGEVKVDKNNALFAHIDGEQLGNPPFLIRVLPRALRLRVL